jgi:uncharacterized protein (TIGR02996 family)
MTRTTADVLLADIAEHPEDDTPRLIYADWLDDHGDADRADFIRLQCRLARMPAGDPGRPDDERREEELLQEHEARWTEPLDHLGAAPVAFQIGLQWLARWQFRRGFVERVSIRGEALQAVAGRLFRLTPVRGLRLTESIPDPDLLFSLPQLAHLTELDIDGCALGQARITALARAEGLANLKSLELSSTKLTPADLATLAAGPALAGLEQLALDFTRIGDEGAAALAHAPALASLSSLRLESNAIGPPGVAALVSSPHLRRLASLNLEGNNFGPDGVEALAASFQLPALRHLNLDSTDAGDDGVAALAAAGSLAALESLDLSCNEMTQAGLTALLASPYMTRLRRLALGCNPLDDNAALALASWPGLAGLTVLEANWLDWSAEAGRALFAPGALAGLTSLDLGYTHIGDEGARVLAGSACVSRLRCLGLGNDDAEPRIGNAGATALAEAPWRALEHLDLRTNDVGDDGALALGFSQSLARLRLLQLENNFIGPAVKEALRKRLGRRLTVEVE